MCGPSWGSDPTTRRTDALRSRSGCDRERQSARRGHHVDIVVDPGVGAQRDRPVDLGRVGRPARRAAGGRPTVADAPPARTNRRAAGGSGRRARRAGSQVATASSGAVTVGEHDGVAPRRRPARRSPPGPRRDGFEPPARAGPSRTLLREQHPRASMPGPFHRPGPAYPDAARPPASIARATRVSGPAICAC